MAENPGTASYTSLLMRCTDLELALLDVKALIESRTPDKQCLLEVYGKVMAALYGDIGLDHAVSLESEIFDLKDRLAAKAA